MTPSPQQRQIAFDQVMEAFFAFFEWCHGVTIRPNERAHVQSMIVARWGDPNSPVKQLVAYVGTQWNTVLAQPPQRRDQLRPQAIRIVQDLLRQANGRGPVLAALHGILEALKPGCTGVPLMPPSAAPCPLPASTPPHAIPIPVHPAGTYPAQPYPPQPNTPPYPASPSPAGFYPANPYAAPPLPGAANPYATPHAAGSAPNPLDPDEVRARLQQETARHQMMSLQIKIQEGQDKMIEKILNSF